MARSEKAISNEWETERALWLLLSSEFSFDTDVCANQGNHLCERWIGPGGAHDNALDPDIRWTEPGGCCFMNPPFNRQQGLFVAEAARRSYDHAHTTVVLIPTYTDTRWWNQFMMQAVEIRDLVGRLKFLYLGQEIGPARFPASVGIFVPWRRVSSAPLRTPWRWRDEAGYIVTQKPAFPPRLAVTPLFDNAGDGNGQAL